MNTITSQTAGVSHVTADDRNFLAVITGILRDKGHPDPEFWLRYNNGILPETATHPDANLRRFHINRQWQSIIAFETLNRRDDQRFISDSITARYGLIDQADCSFDTWLQIMNETLLPFIVRYQIGFPPH